MKTKLLLAFLFAGLLLSCNNTAEEEWIVDTPAEVEVECDEADEYAAYDEFEYSAHSSSERDRQHHHNHQHLHDNNQNNNSQSYESQPRPEWINCPYCMGSGRCQRCGGTGWVMGLYGELPCSFCQANQNGLCSRCAGRGLIPNTY